MGRRRIVVVRDEAALYEQLMASHEPGDEVEIVLNRRQDDGPTTARPDPERRSRPDIDQQIQSEGFAIVTVD